jgi:DNA-binding IscR family transcriptional regulator
LLAKPSAKIRLLDVYRAVADGEVFAFHRQRPNEFCVVGKNIQEAIRPSLVNATQALDHKLGGVTIADIAQEVARLGKFTIPSSGC